MLPLRHRGSPVVGAADGRSKLRGGRIQDTIIYSGNELYFVKTQTGNIWPTTRLKTNRTAHAPPNRSPCPRTATFTVLPGGSGPCEFHLSLPLRLTFRLRSARTKLRQCEPGLGRDHRAPVDTVNAAGARAGLPACPTDDKEWNTTTQTGPGPYTQGTPKLLYYILEIY